MRAVLDNGSARDYDDTVNAARLRDCVSGEKDGAVLARARDGCLYQLLALDIERLCFFPTFILTLGKFLANIERLVLGCIEVKFCK